VFTVQTDFFLLIIAEGFIRLTKQGLSRVSGRRDATTCGARSTKVSFNPWVNILSDAVTQNTGRCGCDGS
jgi:hypothetical protein